MTTALLLVSKTGNGKSSLANALLNTTRFQVGRGMLSSTASCMCISTHARGRDLTVVDTPGTMDVADEEKAKTEIRRAMEFCQNGFDGFLVVVKCDARFTAEERRAIEVVAEMFGDQFYKHAIVVFSHGDEFDNDETEFCNELQETRKKIPYLDQLLTKCGNRFALVDNGRRCDTAVQDRQIEALLSKVDSLVDCNGGKKYTSVEQRNAEEAERKKAEEAEAQRKQAELEAERRIKEQVTAEVKQEQQQRVDWLGIASKLIELGSGLASIRGAFSGSNSAGNAPIPVESSQAGATAQPVAQSLGSARVPQQVTLTRHQAVASVTTPAGRSVRLMESMRASVSSNIAKPIELNRAVFESNSNRPNAPN